jgi:hypothetical protein
VLRYAHQLNRKADKMENTIYTAEYKTRFNGATDTKGESVTVFHNGRQKTFPYDYALNGFENHQERVEAMFLDFFSGSDIEYHSVLRVKDLKHGYKFKAYIELK